MTRLQEPSVEDARLKVEAHLIRMKLREDSARAARSEQIRLRQVDAEKMARLRALRLARVAADDCSSSREKVTAANPAPLLALPDSVHFDYGTLEELFIGMGQGTKHRLIDYRRLTKGADAIRYAPSKNFRSRG